MATRPENRIEAHTDVSLVGTKGTTTGISVVETGLGTHRQTIIELDSVLVPMTDATTSGNYGSVRLYDFPEGVIQIKAAHADFVDGTTVPTGDAAGLARTGSGISATATLKFSVGTAAEASDDTLNSTQADIIASTNCSLTAGAGTARGISGTTPAPYDGTSAAKSLYLNFGVADAGSTGNDVIRVRGRIAFTWEHLGD